ncbi:MAG: hypothetical protein FJ026_04985 [Chloroflexi bacterium]|nr:hypothetical protein [Chloroflexota bacterium]
MLDRLLKLVSFGGAHSLKQLAQQLDTSEGLIESMLDELVRMGYLKSIAGNCHAACPDCPGANNSCLAGAGRLWALTDAGRKMVGAATN